MIKLNNKKGVALIVAVATTVIFMMLVVTVVVISMSTYKKSGQSHDRAIALNFAEAGINDALYQMNYRYYDVPLAYGANYPMDGEYLNLTTFSPGPTTIGTMWQIASPSSPYDPFGVGFGNGYIVQFLAGGANLGQLVSTGIYNNKRRVISINIRGTNVGGAPLNSPTHGIAEAFNKHAVYANTVTLTGTPTITGNIAGVTTGITKTGQRTVTIITPASLFGVPDSTVLTTLPTLVWTYTYRNGKRTDGTNITFEADGFGTHAPGSDTYTFTALTLNTDFNLNFIAKPGSPYATVIIDSLTTIGSSIGTDGSLTFNNNKTIGLGVVFQPALGITVSSGTVITGNLIVAGTPITLNGVTVNGNVLCDNEITLGSVLGGTVIVNGLLYTSALSPPTAVTIGNTSTNDVTINGAVVAKGTVTLNLCTITWNSSNFRNFVGYPDVYSNFPNGRRIYLPVPGSWREK